MNNRFPKGAVTSNGATSSDISTLSKTLGISIPKQLQEILQYSDGFSLGGGLLFYSTDEIVERNETWETKEYAPGYLAFADTGGGVVLLLKAEESNGPVYAVDAGVMDPSEMLRVSDNLEHWLASECPSK